MRILVLLLVTVFSLTSVSSVSAVEFPSFSNFPFPTIKPFPSKTPKPTSSPTNAPSSTPAPTPVSTKFEITDIDPSAANYMEEFTLFGTNFGNSAGSVNFRLSSQSYSSGAATIVSWSNTEITAKVPALVKGAYRIQIVRSDGQKSPEEKFSVKNGQPVVNSNSIVASGGEVEMTFVGKEFGKRGSIDIYDGSTLAGHGVLRSWSTTKIRFDLPSLPRKQYGFQITTADGRKSSIRLFTVGN